MCGDSVLQLPSTHNHLGYRLTWCLSFVPSLPPPPSVCSRCMLTTFVLLGPPHPNSLPHRLSPPLSSEGCRPPNIDVKGNFGRGCGLVAGRNMRGDPWGPARYAKRRAIISSPPSIYLHCYLLTLKICKDMYRLLMHPAHTTTQHTDTTSTFLHLPRIQERAGRGCFDAIRTFSLSLACKSESGGGFMAFRSRSHLLHPPRTQV